MGIDKNALKEDIKKAYRRLAVKHHPDTSGHADSNIFCEIQEAYEILINTQKRAQYDRELNLINNIPFAQEFKSSYFINELNKIYYRNKNSVEIILSSEEAQYGAEIELTIPIIQTCPHCEYVDSIFGFMCDYCYGEGFVVAEKNVTLNLPPIHHKKAVFDVSLENLSAVQQWLKLYVVVDDGWSIDF